MQLNVIINKNEFSSINNKIMKIKNFITLYIQDNTGYIANGIVEKDDAFYFGKCELNSNKYQIISSKQLKEYNESESYIDYSNTAQSFIEKWSKIGIIKIEDNDNE